MTATRKGRRTAHRLGRIARFSLVGAIGIGVQLVALTALTHCGINYLLATALAVEAAILHNFLWHQHFTWADRPSSGAAKAFLRLCRFHVSNGAILLVGNLFMMRVLVGWMGTPVVIANVMTISGCALANLLASNRWVFVVTQPTEEGIASGSQIVAGRSSISNSVRCAKGR